MFFPLRVGHSTCLHAKCGETRRSETDALTSARAMLDRMFRTEMAFMKAADRNPEALVEAFHPLVVIHEPRSLPYGGDWIGLTGVARLMRQMGELFSGMEIQDLTCSGSPESLHVYCTLRMSIRATSVTLVQPFAEVLRFEDGRLIEGTPFYFDTSALVEAFGGTAVTARETPPAMEEQPPASRGRPHRASD